MTDRKTLAAKQAAFMRAILDQGAPLPKGWGDSHALGLSVYRGNYRSALMSALEETYERTARYIGEEGFRTACINHAIANPPSHWTIDAAGEGFDRTCADLFPNNREVSELAWLEWTMLELADAPNSEAVTPQDFAQASASFGDAEWMGLELTFQPRAAARLVTHDMTALWKSLDEPGEDRDLRGYETPQGCLVWREGERPTFIMTSADTAQAFIAVQTGARYGDLIGLVAGDDADEAAITEAAQKAGAMLGQWLGEGIVTGFRA
ncbi:MAG: DNA-binding domain-containing protein [Erythrobacter sp.]|uniref:HvfC/BufC N-terminal domain-containing protein n=1 Tax=Erythrobacter sp. TaxID=1042 RepID=UPI002611C063|nr:DNA-binding domain-containing protein [Erythrobacter sp.]MDJ0979276.1 DNA-binding domain-containing protein [Erythrobacter sp.]